MDERLKDALKQKEALTDLLSSTGWSIVTEVIEAQIARRTESVMWIPLGEDGKTVYQQEFLKGEVAGMKLFITLAESMLDGASALLATVKEHEDGEGETDDDRRDDDSN
jgi:hypothetical protein